MRFEREAIVLGRPPAPLEDRELDEHGSHDDDRRLDVGDDDHDRRRRVDDELDAEHDDDR